MIDEHLGVTKDGLYGCITNKAMPATRLPGCGSSRSPKLMPGFVAKVAGATDQGAER